MANQEDSLAQRRNTSRLALGIHTNWHFPCPCNIFIWVAWNGCSTVSPLLPYRHPSIVLTRLCRHERVFGESISNATVDNTIFIYGSSWLTIYCIIANIPQLAITALYFAFSSLYSALFQNKEWAEFAIKSRPLRVSFPNGQQATSYPLQYPSIWGFSFIFLKGTLGWLLTQSFYIILNACTWQLLTDAVTNSNSTYLHF